MADLSSRVGGDSSTWAAYNELALCGDSGRLRKLIVRAELLKDAIRFPGDVFECGVYKGAGLFTWAKLLKIYGAHRRTIGFDTFSEFARQDTPDERAAAADLVAWAGFEGVSVEDLKCKAVAADISIELVEGMIQKTAPKFAARYPHQRIALLNLDLDFYSPTMAALESFWPLVTPGGLVLFDEYGAREFTESGAVDEFLSKRGVRLETVPHSHSPTAFVRKPQ